MQKFKDTTKKYCSFGLPANPYITRLSGDIKSAVKKHCSFGNTANPYTIRLSGDSKNAFKNAAKMQ
ncbi:hypothetical protein [Candidatus Tisiphia endosymbiont of Temnostethus pusillus]|uniref:hypothetical protein n=1 Tax=Candidatus Tisiphia endosymbiont of Temnostethus pusillus TaxID=3139335 RepID=UPI0035C89EBD